MEDVKKDKKNLLIIILIIIILTLIAYIVFISVNKKETTNDYQNNINNNDNLKEEKPVTYDRSALDFSGCDFEVNDTCTRTYKDIEVNIYIGSYGTKNVKINDKDVVKNVFYTSDIFDIMDDVIIFTIGHTDIRSTTIYAFDKNGNELLKLFDNIDNKYPSMRVNDLKGKDFYNIKGNKITFGGSRVHHFETLVLSDNEEIHICEDQNNEKYKDEIAEGEYEIEYLGNNKFSKIKNTKYTSVKDSEFFDYCY